jgi:CrcB protein
MISFKNILTVMLGSGIGGALRFISSEYIKQYLPTRFPYGTFFVNLLGCFIIGAVYGRSLKGSQNSNEIKLLLATGFCGGFTTFSAFTAENIELIRNGNQTTALLYIILSVTLGITATFIGSALFK